MSDPHKAVLLAYERMGFCNPVSAATLDRVLAWTGLEPGMRALDIGCGNAAMAVHLEKRFGVAVDALERSPAVAEIARRRAADAAGVTVHNVESRQFLKDAAPYDLVLSVGASGVVDGPPEPQAVMAAIKPYARPGALVLWADPFWKAEPDPAFVAQIAPHAAYKTHQGNIAAGEAAGLKIVYAITSTQQDWDDVAYSMYAAAENWLAANPGHPQAEEVRQRAEMQLAAYVNHGRDTLGFGLYLFRRPQS